MVRRTEAAGGAAESMKDGGETELKLILLQFCAGDISESLGATF